MNTDRRPIVTPEGDSRLVITLGGVVLTVAVLQTSIVPVLDVVAGQLHTSPVAVSWAVTANLLAAAAATPLIGRLADLFNKKRVLLAALGLILVGSLLGAVTSSLPLLILGRVMQGMSFSLYPIAVSILRDELPAERLVRSMAMLSAMLGFGGAFGLVVTGFLMPSGASYHRVFWLNTVAAIAVAVAAAVVVPNRPNRVSARIDWAGALGLAAGLCSLMLAVTQGSTWGWTSIRTTGAAATGVAILTLWWRRSRRVAQPLVSTEMLTRRPILLANSATFLVGMGLYFSFLGMTDFVETPRTSGYGFGASILDASVEFLMPGALAAAVTALISGRCIERFGARAVVAGGGTAGVIGFLMLAGWHSTRWEVIAAGLLTNAYISLAYGALPALIVGEVDKSETGVATSLNGIFRKVGGAAAAAMVAALLTPTGAGFPSESGFTIVFALGAATAAGSVLLVWLGRERAAAVRVLSFRMPTGDASPQAA
jgi:MFS family permease